MVKNKIQVVTAETHTITSALLKRVIKLSIYFPSGPVPPGDMHLLFINDGQDLEVMHFGNILSELYLHGVIQPLLCVGIDCGEDRRNEYGTANILDYKGRGIKANLYQRFIFEELLPFIRTAYKIPSFREKSFCGFSLGGLSALDIVWNHPEEFMHVGVFSGSLWWRSVSQDDPLFNEDKHRIMHNRIRQGGYYPWLKFFFETGTLDETADRNKNGIIDSIDDTISLIDELIKKGYNPDQSIHYIELKDGKHDVTTWGKAFPAFLVWGWGR